MGWIKLNDGAGLMRKDDEQGDRCPDVVAPVQCSGTGDSYLRPRSEVLETLAYLMYEDRAMCVAPDVSQKVGAA